MLEFKTKSSRDLQDIDSSKIGVGTRIFKKTYSSDLKRKHDKVPLPHRTQN